MDEKSYSNYRRSIGDKALPRIKMDENVVITEHVLPRVTGFRKVLLFLEPKGCMKERDDYALYIFPPNNK